ncbi:hypothetical protein SAMN05660776_1365 [Salegentibacter holothuriorum]|uniref:Uncharacterized protein n=1 Tax=Salegentibacter holothuriorum TaxID=241145 RepID=A0A1T5BPB1_9FLAO|nr:hypothetical protein [Salegentibacter holothuriorum]SKB48975.1 hypothetical protein SAMN05660776_1365 [Salegentibacter holothuriorum]
MKSPEQRLKNLISSYSRRVHNKLRFETASEAFKIIRQISYDFDTNAYSIKNTKNFISTYNVNSQDYIRFAEEVFRVYFFEKKIGLGRATKFLRTLKKSKNFNSLAKFGLRKNKDINDVFKLVNLIVETLCISKKEALELTHRNIETGYSLSYFKKIYSEDSENL